MEADIAYSITYVGHTPRSIFRWNLARIRSKMKFCGEISGLWLGEQKIAGSPNFE